MKKTLIPKLFVFVIAFAATTVAQQQINYLGYQITITRPKTTQYSVVSVIKGKSVVARHRKGISTDYGSTIELISLLGTSKKQLVISQYTGGAHCCNLYWIYELTPKFRLLFRSEDFETIGYSEIHELFQNIDTDADLEIIDHTPAFHYFDELAFVSSPAPTLTFDYNRRTRKFELANRRFARYLLKDETEAIERSQAVRKSNPSQHLVDSLGIFLDFVYAGKEQSGWNYYHQEKTRSDWGRYFHQDATIKRALYADPAYRSIYGK